MEGMSSQWEIYSLSEQAIDTDKDGGGSQTSARLTSNQPWKDIRRDPNKARQRHPVARMRAVALANPARILAGHPNP